jgi:predicted metal-dependent phosphoesterase TrpH
MGKVDLHIHTTASDGRFSPAEIVLKAQNSGLEYIAITDHDSVDGVVAAQETAGRLSGITVIAGVEINTDIPAGELHILGYFIEVDNRELTAGLERLRNSRVERAKRMVQKLNALGVKIDYRRVQELAGTGSVGRPHVAEAMLEKGYITTLKEAFNRYIGRNGPAYVERDKITPADATKLILQAQGIPVMAHPLTSENHEKLIAELKSAGLMGLEIYYNGYSLEQIDGLLTIAQNYDLISTGGSDFHGLDAAAEPPLGTVEVPAECVEQLMQLHIRHSGNGVGS